MPTPPYRTPPFEIDVQMQGNVPQITLTWSQGWTRWLNEVGKCSRVLVEDQTLTTDGPTEITGPQPIRDGIVLVEILRQDGTGGRKIAWDASFDQTPADIDTTADTESTYIFVGHHGKWLFLAANPGRPLSA